MTFDAGRRRAALALLCLAATRQAVAQPALPATIRLVVPFAPGGSTDLAARLLAERTGRLLGRQMIVENRPGAGGHLGSSVVARSAPDGSTLLLNGTGPLAISMAANAPLSYDPLRDLAPIGIVTRLPNVLVVNAALPIRSVDELVAWIRANPGKATYGMSAVGNLSHLQAEMFAQAAGVQLVGVAYKGSGPLITDLVGGTIQLAIDNLPAYLPHIESGRLRALAVTSAQRSSLLPQVPPLAELGFKGFDHPAIFSIFGPAGLPPELVRQFNDAFNRALADGDVAQQLRKAGLEPSPGTPEQLAARLQFERAEFGRVIRENGIKLN